jgi:hypothetical protein
MIPVDEKIAQLLLIEADAQKAMLNISKDNETVTLQAQERLKQRLAAIEKDGAEEIRRLVSEAETQTAAQISLAQEEFSAKSEAFTADFAAKRKALRGEIFHNILQGDV